VASAPHVASRLVCTNERNGSSSSNRSQVKQLHRGVSTTHGQQVATAMKTVFQVSAGQVATDW
jgi:hypothetical protein